MATNEAYLKLFEFCATGDRIGLADHIITSGCIPSAYDARDSAGKTALHIACRHGNLFIVRSLIEIFDCNPTIRDIRGNLPLHDACMHGNLAIVDYLLSSIKPEDSVSAIFLADLEGNTLLHKACQSGSAATVRYIQQYLCYPKHLILRKLNLYLDSVTPYVVSSEEMTSTSSDFRNSLVQCILRENSYGDTPIHVACRHGHLNVLKVFQAYLHCSGCLESLIAIAFLGNHRDIADYLSRLGIKQQLDFNSEAVEFKSKYQTFEALEQYLQPQVVRKLLKCTQCGTIYEVAQIAHFDGNTKGICPFCSKNKEFKYFFQCGKCNTSLKSTNLVWTQCIVCGSSEITLEADHKEYSVDPSPYRSAKKSAAQTAAVCGNLELFKLACSFFSTSSDLVRVVLLLACISDNVELVRHIMDRFKCGVNVSIPNLLNASSPLHVACEWGSCNVFLFLTSFSDLKRDCLNEEKDTPLTLACRYSRNAMCDELLKSYDPSHYKDCKETPLHLACGNNSFDLAKKIFANSGTLCINIPDRNGDTPLFNACRCANLEIIAYLISNGSDPLYINNQTKETPVHIACRMGRADILQTLLTDNIDINSLGGNIYGATPLQLAIESDCQELLVVLMNMFNIDANQLVNENKTTLAHYATYLESKSLLECLLQLSVNWDAQNFLGNTALHLACIINNAEIVSLIIDHSSMTVQNSKGQTPVHIAASKQNVSLLTLLLKSYSASLNDFQDYDGNTALHTACETEPSVGITSLLTKFCSVTIQNSFNQTALHLACRSKKVAVIEHLLNEFPSTFDFNSSLDKDGNSALHIAVSQKPSSLEVASLLIEKMSPTCQNKAGENPIHIACRNGDLNVVHLLVSVQPDVVVTKKGDTYLHSACYSNSFEMVKFLVSESGLSLEKLSVENEEGNTPLHCACLKAPLEIISHLMDYSKPEMHTLNKKQHTPFCCLLAMNRMETIQSLIKTDPTVQSKWCSDGMPMFHTILKHVQSPLDAFKLIQYVAENNYSHDHLKCDETGNTILHCFAKQLLSHNYSFDLNYILLWEYLISLPGIEINKQNCDGDTLLHLLCKCDFYIESKFLIESLLTKAESSVQESLNKKNSQGKTPIQLVRKPTMKLLIQYGANPTDVYNEFQPILDRFKMEQPLEPSVKIVVVGNSRAGKTTLVSTLKQLDSPEVKGPILSVDGPTAGMKTSDHNSKDFGRVIFHDFAGQPEYQSSNSAFLESLKQPPIFLLLVDVCVDSRLTNLTLFWFNQIENHLPQQLETPPHVIVIGSHVDRVHPTQHDNIRRCIDSAIKKVHSMKFHIVGPILLDCRKIQAAQMKELSLMLSKSCSNLRKSVDFDIRCHILFAFLSKWFSKLSAVKLSEIQTRIKLESAGRVSSAITPPYLASRFPQYHDDVLLPFTKDTLLDLLKSLHAGGHILLLGPERTGDYWVVMDSDVLFEKVSGPIFAPAGFIGPKLETNTGVVSEEMLSSLFEPKKIETDLITAFTVHSEFCQKIKDSETLQLIENACSPSEKTTKRSVKSDSGGATSHVSGNDLPKLATADEQNSRNYYFFPGLVKSKRPDDVWPGNSTRRFGWYLLCNQDNYLDTRFLYVLLLRLTFSFAAAGKATSQQGLVRECNIWNNGIHWCTRSGVEVYVEIINQNTGVLLLTQYIEDFEMEEVKLRSKVIKKILDTKETFCPTVKVTEYILTKCTHFPEDSDLQQRIPIAELAQSVANGDPCVIDFKRKPHVLKSLLFFDSYLGIGKSFIEQLWLEEKSDKDLPSDFLFELSEAQRTFVNHMSKLLDLSQREVDSYKAKWEAEPSKLLLTMYESWKSKQNKPTYQLLRDVFNSHSIFCGRNPLVSIYLP